MSVVTMVTHILSLQLTQITRAKKKVTRAGGSREKSRESSTQNETWVEGLARLLSCGSLFSPYMESLLAG